MMEQLIGLRLQILAQRRFVTLKGQAVGALASSGSGKGRQQAAAGVFQWSEFFKNKMGESVLRYTGKS